MIVEYERWGYPKQRLLIGGLQFLGGLGLLVGLYFKPLIPLSSASLLLFMLSAIGVRIKIKDQPSNDASCNFLRYNKLYSFNKLYFLKQ